MTGQNNGDGEKSSICDMTDGDERSKSLKYSSRNKAAIFFLLTQEREQHAKTENIKQ